MAGDNYKKREACNQAAWVGPKREQKKFSQKLTQLRSHVILCFRAEEKTDMVKGEDGKWELVPSKRITGLNGWVPISEKSLPFELTASFLLTADAPGIVKPIKLPEHFRPFLPLGSVTTEDSGAKLRTWAAGFVPAGVKSEIWAAWTLEERGDNRALEGTAELVAWWKSLTAEERKELEAKKEKDWKPAAAFADGKKVSA
jgi:hypothetical protein